MDDQAVEIAASVKQVLETVPPDVIVVAAAKGRTPTEVKAAIEAGITHVGHNHIQEAQAAMPVVSDNVTWHMIGHLQRNKVKKAVELFDVIETVDSWRLAKALDRRCASIGKIMPVLVEINSGREASKTGALPEDVDDLVERLSELQHIRVQGLMTMASLGAEPAQRNHALPLYGHEQ